MAPTTPPPLQLDAFVKHTAVGDVGEAVGGGGTLLFQNEVIENELNTLLARRKCTRFGI